VCATERALLQESRKIVSAEELLKGAKYF